MSSEDIVVTVRVKDPLVAALIRQIADRSNAGAKEYGHNSLVERISDPKRLVKDAVEEAIDQMIYLGAALSVLPEDQKGKSKSKSL